MVPFYAATSTFLLGLTAASSLFLCSTALPSSAPSRLSLSSRSVENYALLHNSGAVPQQPRRKRSQYDDVDDATLEESDFTHGYHPADSLITRQRPSSPVTTSSSLPSRSSKPSSKSPSSLYYQTYIFSNQRQQQLHQQNQDQGQGHHASDITSFHPETSRTTRDQILHHCTTHFLDLLDSGISDRLMVRLSRLIMMLPVIGVETREVMRTKVVQVMQEASTRLKDYESIRRVIRIAVDDAGLLSIDDGQTVVRGHRTRLDGTMQQTTRRAQFKDQEDMNDVDGNLSGDDKANGDDDVDDESDVDANNDDKGSVWFRRAGSRSPSTVPNPRKNRLTDAASIDDTQIPIVAEVAMEAVLDYVSEILSPTLVIHQLTEGIQSALQQISKAKALQSTKDGISTDEGNDTDLDINTLSSQSASMSDSDHHGLDLLSDDWVGNGIEEKEEEGEEDLKGQDEDLWDRDMETHDWDSTGHLFEDLEGGIEEGNSLQQPKALTSGADNEDEQEEDADYEGSVSPFSIGIQEEDGDQQQQEQGDDDDMTDEDEGKGSLWAGYTAQRRFHKRRLLEEDDERSSQEEVDVRVQAAAATSNSKAAPLLRKRNEPALLSRRRPDFAPDPRLETLLAQLIEPVLITFIDEDLPASCRRVQGELMDGIIWSLDQSQRMKNANSVQDRLALLAELEY